MNNPDQTGKYLVLAYEYVGTDRPSQPEWKVRHWDGKRWERAQYCWDTGGYECFELVSWQHLQPNCPTEPVE